MGEVGIISIVYEIALLYIAQERAMQVLGSERVKNPGNVYPVHGVTHFCVCAPSVDSRYSFTSSENIRHS